MGARINARSNEGGSTLRGSCRSASTLGALVALVWCVSAGAVVRDTGPEPTLDGCGVEQYAGGNFNDYRLRDTSAALSWSVGDIKNNHLDPAMRRMMAGEYTRNVIADLDFMLRGWPNHYPALEALVRYDLAGGKQFDFKSVPCYFARAKAFASDDVVVRLQEGYYYWKKGRLALAERSYKEALRLDPQSPDAHYNLGLLYAETGDYKAAMSHAAVAYDAGYPLLGLRRKLEKAGAWNAAATARPAAN